MTRTGRDGLPNLDGPIIQTPASVVASQDNVALPYTKVAKVSIISLISVSEDALLNSDSTVWRTFGRLNDRRHRGQS